MNANREAAIREAEEIRDERGPNRVMEVQRARLWDREPSEWTRYERHLSEALLAAEAELAAARAFSIAQQEVIVAQKEQVRVLREAANAVRSDVKLVRETLSDLDSRNEALDALARIAGFVGRAALDVAGERS